MNRRWKIKEQGNINEIDSLSHELQIDKILANLLIQRGYNTFEKTRSFFHPDLSDLYDPFLMKDMNIAIDRIITAIKKNEKILIYGDYDVDGTTSVALIYSFLKKRYSYLDYYIPDRYSEGYGISFKAVDYAYENNCSLVIALDCGIKAIDKIKYANERKIDFIICDHHLPGNNIPNALAILDPKRKDCQYPFKELSGCGVGFKLLQAYAQENNIPFDELTSYLDLVAVSISSDIVPVIDENRILVYYGLQQLNYNPKTGLKSLIKVARIENRDISVDDIVFKIGPRINAAGRIESGKKAVDILITEDYSTAIIMGKKINAYNNARKNIDRNITQDALRMLAADPKTANRKSTVLFHHDWHKGVVGIVASRLTETYYRPTIVLTESNGFATGSARSVPGFDLYQAIDACKDLLENFGGHMYAAGLTLKIENIPVFKEKFESVVAQTITPEQLIPQVEIDTEINLKDITPKFFHVLKQFQPFGPENITPVFITKNVVDTGEARIVGTSGEHLKLNLSQKEEPDHIFPAIAFQQAYHLKIANSGKPFDISYSIEENVFRGNVTLQLNIKDIKGQ